MPVATDTHRWYGDRRSAERSPDERHVVVLVCRQLSCEVLRTVECHIQGCCMRGVRTPCALVEQATLTAHRPVLVRIAWGCARTRVTLELRGPQLRRLACGRPSRHPAVRAKATTCRGRTMTQVGRSGAPRRSPSRTPECTRQMPVHRLAALPGGRLRRRRSCRTRQRSIPGSADSSGPAQLCNCLAA